ncbi:hypothetical protein, partial [Actinoplanes regularis]|uniref:hypothetical protein n=1 Tax=Actinoplanes regularis TaxID=52697 RepID=UPI002552ACA6
MSVNSVAKRGFDDLGMAGKVERVPRRAGREYRGLFDGVRLFFENSTGCLISQCQLWQYPGLSLSGVGWRFLWQLFVAGTLFQRFLLESLILAQDERWRRA